MSVIEYSTAAPILSNPIYEDINDRQKRRVSGIPIAHKVFIQKELKHECMDYLISRVASRHVLFRRVCAASVLFNNEYHKKHFAAIRELNKNTRSSRKLLNLLPL